MSNESDRLMVSHVPSRKPPPMTTTLEEYGSIAIAVVENAEHQPVVVHDYVGPLLLDKDTLERHDSFAESIAGSLGGEGREFPPVHDIRDVEGEATIPSEIANLAKNLIGCGVLSLSGGIARCADSPRALIPANLWIVTLGIIFGYFCYLIAKVCDMTGRTTYRGIWQDTMGHRGAVAVSLANALKAAMADLAYASILSDTLASLFLSINLQVRRITCLLLVTTLAILPLCLLKNLHMLAPFSVLGTAGIIFTTFAMAIRYLDGSYAPGGKFYNDIDPSYQPLFGSTNHAWGTALLPFVCMAYEAYVMHYNSARFYTELKDRSLPRFAIAVSSSFGMSAILYMGIASLGFLTFGGKYLRTRGKNWLLTSKCRKSSHALFHDPANSNSFILNNYSPNDPLATVSRLAVGLSTLVAYPIVFHGVRDGVLDVFEVPFTEQTPERVNRLTLILLTILTITAVFITDLGLINAVGGGLVGTAIVCVFPTIMFQKAVSMKLRGYQNQQKEVVWAFVLTVIGGIIGIIGAWLAVAGGATS